jgi:NADH:ubiquinone oxidoreductase subunit 6 (subunit J)
MIINNRYNCYVQNKQKGERAKMTFQIYYLIAIVVILGAIALAMHFSIKRYDKKMAETRKKKRRR